MAIQNDTTKISEEYQFYELKLVPCPQCILSIGKIVFLFVNPNNQKFLSKLRTEQQVREFIVRHLTREGQEHHIHLQYSETNGKFKQITNFRTHPLMEGKNKDIGILENYSWNEDNIKLKSLVQSYEQRQIELEDSLVVSDQQYQQEMKEITLELDDKLREIESYQETLRTKEDEINKLKTGILTRNNDLNTLRKKLNDSISILNDKEVKFRNENEKFNTKLTNKEEEINRLELILSKPVETTFEQVYQFITNNNITEEQYQLLLSGLSKHSDEDLQITSHLPADPTDMLGVMVHMHRIIVKDFTKLQEIFYSDLIRDFYIFVADISNFTNIPPEIHNLTAKMLDYYLKTADQVAKILLKDDDFSFTQKKSIQTLDIDEMLTQQQWQASLKVSGLLELFKSLKYFRILIRKIVGVCDSGINHILIPQDSIILGAVNYTERHFVVPKNIIDQDFGLKNLLERKIRIMELKEPVGSNYIIAVDEKTLSLIPNVGWRFIFEGMVTSDNKNYLIPFNKTKSIVSNGMVAKSKEFNILIITFEYEVLQYDPENSLTAKTFTSNIENTGHNLEILNEENRDETNLKESESPEENQSRKKKRVLEVSYQERAEIILDFCQEFKSREEIAKKIGNKTVTKSLRKQLSELVQSKRLLPLKIGKRPRGQKYKTNIEAGTVS
jgi:hypothetical protein